MLKLFAGVFGRAHDATSTLPDTLVEQLVERAVDGTDPRLRIVSGYAKALRKPVIHAAQHIIDMIDKLPDALPLAPGSLRDSPLLAAVLYSEAETTKLVARDAALLEYRAANAAAAGPVTALLAVQRSEKRGFGYAQVGDQTLADVPKTTVSFTHHRLLEPGGEDAVTRRGVKRRAFDLLLAIALARITTRKETRTELAGQKALLCSKRDILQRSAGFAEHATSTEQARLQQSLTEIEEKLAALGPDTDALQSNLDALVEVLASAEQHLWLEEPTLYLDKFYVAHNGPAPGATELVCRDLHNSEGRCVTLQLVRLPAPQAQPN